MKNKKYWFRKREGINSKDMGYGWVPISWQGVLAVLFFVAVAVFAANYFEISSGGLSAFLKFVATLIGAMIILTIIAWFKSRR